MLKTKYQNKFKSFKWKWIENLSQKIVKYNFIGKIISK